MKRGVGFASLLLASASAVGGQPFDDARRAYDDGRFDEAVAAYRQLADAGEPRAQLLLGLMLRDGDHVNRDSVGAYAWLDVASKDVWYGTAVAQPADQARIALASSMTGQELIHADQQVIAYERALRESYGKTRAAAGKAFGLDGAPPAPEIYVGCGSNPEGARCGEARSAGARAHACAAEGADPDIPASSLGPLARLEWRRTDLKSLADWLPRGGHPVEIFAVAEVDSSGFVCRAVLVKADKEMTWTGRQAALKLIGSSRFQPAIRRGKPVDSYIRIVFGYNI